MANTDDLLEAERQMTCTRIEQLRPEWEALQERLQEITRAQQRRQHTPEVRCQIRLVAAAEPHSPEPAVVKVLPDVESNRPVDPAKLVEHAARGTALFAPGPGDDPRGQIVLLVRGESHHLKALGESPAVQFRAAVFAEPEANLVLVPILVSLGPEQPPESIYEAWVNQSPGGLAKTLAALAGQEDVALYLYGDGSNLVRVVRVPNTLRAFAREALNAARAGRPLSADDFHQARAAVYKRHPTVAALWRALKG
jgi:hypothetical protein